LSHYRTTEKGSQHCEPELIKSTGGLSAKANRRKSEEKGGRERNRVRTRSFNELVASRDELRKESSSEDPNGVTPKTCLPASRSRKQTEGQVYDVRTIRLRRGLLDAVLTSSEHSEESTTTTTSLVLSNPSSGHGKGTSWRFVVPAALTPLDVREKSNSNKISLIPALLPETRPEWFRNFGRSFRVTRNLRSTSLTGFIGSCFYPEVRAVKKKKTFRIFSLSF